MKLKNFNNFFSKLIFLSLLIFLGLGQLPASGLVLCVGNDGHVDLEASNSDQKCVMPLSKLPDFKNKHEIQKQPYNFNHCGVCSDVPLSSTKAESKTLSAGFSISDINPGSSFFITFNFPPELKAETTKKDYRIHSKSVNYSYLPQIEKVVIIC